MKYLLVILNFPIKAMKRESEWLSFHCCRFFELFCFAKNKSKTASRKQLSLKISTYLTTQETAKLVNKPT
jgi:hypothetical protein